MGEALGEGQQKWSLTVASPSAVLACMSLDKATHSLLAISTCSS